MSMTVCDTCEGTGEIDNEDEESALEWPTLPCPDCDGTGERLRLATRLLP